MAEINVVYDQLWIRNNIVYPYFILPSLKDSFKGYTLTIFVSICGGTTDSYILNVG